MAEAGGSGDAAAPAPAPAASGPRTEHVAEDEYGQYKVVADAQGKVVEDEFGPFKVDEKVWTMNEIRDHPMFMVDVPRNIDDNEHLLALQNIMYDGQTPEDMAEHFKQLGNKAFKESITNDTGHQNALFAYTRALEMEGTDKALNSAIHSNRAAVSIRMKEYSKAIDDCRKAIDLDKSNIKAYFRAATASEVLDLTSQALGFATDARRLKPEDADVRKLCARLKNMLDVEDDKRSNEKSAAAQKREQVAQTDAGVRKMLEERGVRLGNYLFDISMYAAHGSIKPELTEDDPMSVKWPILFLYDETTQSDFVGSFDERCDLEEQFQIMFPEDHHPHWDDDGKYIWDRLVAYLEVYSGDGTQMMKMHLDQPIQGQLSGHRVPPVLVMHVLVDGHPAHDVFLRTSNMLES